MPHDRDWRQIGQGSEPWCPGPIVKFLAVSRLPSTSVFNDGYIAEQDEAFRRSPDSVDEGWRQFFRFAATLAGGSGGGVVDAHQLRIAAGAASLADAIRRFGHLAVSLDPLGTAPPGSPDPQPEVHRITQTDLPHLPASALGQPKGSAADVIDSLRQHYCSTLACEFDHVGNDAERVWLHDQIESGVAEPPLTSAGE